jgi:hypothetical protein
MPTVRPPRPAAAPLLRPEALIGALGWARWSRPGVADRAWLIRAAAVPWSPAPLAAALQAAGAGPLRAVGLAAAGGAWRLSAEAWDAAAAAALGAPTLAAGLRSGPPPLLVVHHEGGPLEDLPEPTLLGLCDWICGALPAALPPGGAGLRLLLPIGPGRLPDSAGLAERALTAALNTAEDLGLGHLLPA